MKPPIHPDEALAHVLEHARAHRMPFETVSLSEATGRVLAKEAVSLVDQPPFAKAAVDGFAYRRNPSLEDAGGPYEIVSVASAGQAPGHGLAPGQAVRIMTGAPVPEGTDGIVRVEWTRVEENRVHFLKAESVSNVIARGENARRGETLMEPRILMPQDVGILAAAGHACVPVARRPRVAVISTGDEIRPACIEASGDLSEAFSRAARELGSAGIFDSNGPQLCACVHSFGAEAKFFGIVPDDVARIRETVAAALESFDAVVVSGGVSMGDFDHIPAAAEASGVKLVFHGVRMRPGMPAFFGVRGPAAFFGLPGNPVSTFVHAVTLLRPYLLARMGFDAATPVVPVRMASALTRRKGDHVQFWPASVRWPEGTAVPLPYHGSSMITVLAHANALIRMEEGQTELQPGELVHARLLRPHH